MHRAALKAPGPLLVKLAVTDGAVALPTCWQASTVLVMRNATVMVA